MGVSGHLTSLLGDERVTRRAAAGDRRAFEEIYRRYHQPLYRFCLAMVGNASDAQDALQNTMVKVLRALPGESREIALKPWLYRIARNEAVETLRRRPDQVGAEQEQIASPMEISEAAADRERLRRLFADIRELPERQRGALVMRELSGLGFDEIAKALQTSPTTARQTVYEARLGLRQMEAGREMRCEIVTKVLSDADGRAAGRRDLRAHLRDCTSCRAFRNDIVERQGQFAAIAPLPLAASAFLLRSLLGGSASGAAGTGAGGGAGAAVGSGAGHLAASSVVVKSVAAIAAATAIGTAVVDGGGFVDLPLSADGQPAESSQSASDAQGPQTGDNAAAAKPKGATRTRGQVGSRGSAGRNGPSAAATGRGPGLHDDAEQAGATPADRPGPHQGGSTASGRPSGSNSGSAGGSRGGGHGSSAAGQIGPPEGLPEAASHGQQTAAAHKPPQANSSPGPGSAGKGAPPSAPPDDGGPPQLPPPPTPPGSQSQAGNGAPPDPPSPPPNHGDPPAAPPPDPGGGPS